MSTKQQQRNLVLKTILQILEHLLKWITLITESVDFLSKSSPTTDRALKIVFRRTRFQRALNLRAVNFCRGSLSHYRQRVSVWGCHILCFLLRCGFNEVPINRQIPKLQNPGKMKGRVELTSVQQHSTSNNNGIIFLIIIAKDD